MNFNLSFNTKQGDCCKVVSLTDTTCMPNFYDKYACCDGYGVDSNISRDDVGSTKFHIQMPDGTEFFNLDFGWTPGTRSKFQFVVSSGTNGVIIVDLDGVIIGQQYFVTDIDTTIALLINNINVLASQTKWQASLLEGTTDTIVLEAIEFGVEYNGKIGTITVSGDIVATIPVAYAAGTIGANGNTDTVTFDLNDIYGAGNCPNSNEFADGVYHITYILFDDAGAELHRVTNVVLFTCRIKSIIRKLILLTAEEKCSCSDKFDERLIELRLMLEKAEVLMDNCQYDCANDTILRAHKFAQGICLDC
jgi:hypothetical protein